jgi:hypothetical protein
MSDLCTFLILLNAIWLIQGVAFLGIWLSRR